MPPIDRLTGPMLRREHAALLQYGMVGCRRLQLKVVPDALPEGFQVSHRPAPQRVIGIKLQAVLALQPARVQAYLGKGGSAHRLQLNCQRMHKGWWAQPSGRSGPQCLACRLFVFQRSLCARQGVFGGDQLPLQQNALIDFMFEQLVDGGEVFC